MTSPLLTGFDLYTIRTSLTLAGYAYVCGLPDDFDYPLELARLGPLVHQYGGALVRDVKPDPSISNTVVSSANMAELTPHTEWYEFAGPPPRYVALSTKRDWPSRQLPAPRHNAPQYPLASRTTLGASHPAGPGPAGPLSAARRPRRCAAPSRIRRPALATLAGRGARDAVGLLATSVAAASKMLRCYQRWWPAPQARHRRKTRVSGRLCGLGYGYAAPAGPGATASSARVAQAPGTSRARAA
jgi:hypothetical protein